MLTIKKVAAPAKGSVGRRLKGRGSIGEVVGVGAVVVDITQVQQTVRNRGMAAFADHLGLPVRRQRGGTGRGSWRVRVT